MAFSFRKFLQGIRLLPTSSSNVANQGEMEVLSSNGKMNYHNGTTASPMVTEAHSATLTNKTIDGDDNTVQDLPLTSIKTNITDASKFIVRDASGIPVSSTKAVPTGIVVGTTDTQTLTNKTLDDTTTSIADTSDPTKQIKFDAAGTTGTSTTLLSSQTTNKTLTLPNATDTLVGKATTDTLTNKTLDDSTTAISDTSDPTKQIKFDAAGTTGTSTTLLSSQTTNKTLTLPNATDTLVGKATTDTLTNKTLDDTTTVIADTSDPTKKIKFDAAGTTGTATTLLSSQTTDKTLTLPNATDTLVGKATTDTLTNKTMGDALGLTQVATPSNPSSGFNKIYSKSDNSLYILSSAGVETQIGGAGGSNAATLTFTLDTDVATLTAGENIAARDAVCLDISSGAYKVFKANSTTATRKTGRIGIATAAATSGNSVTIRFTGTVTGFSGLTFGAIYYLDSVAGAITTSPADASPQAIGQALSTSVLFVDRNMGTSGFFNTGVAFIRAFGGSAGGVSKTSATNTSEHFNFTSWSSGTSDSGNLHAQQNGDSSLNGYLVCVDGVNASPATVNGTRLYDKSSWSAGTARTNQKSAGGAAQLNSNLYVGFGSTSTSTSATNGVDKWNGSSWTNGVASGTARAMPSCFQQGVYVFWAGALPGANTNEKFDGTTLSSSTNCPNSFFSCSGSTSSGGKGLLYQSNSGGSTITVAYTFDGSSFSSSIALNYTIASDNSTGTGGASGYYTATTMAYTNGGSGSSGSSSLTNTQKFNGTAYSSDTASSTARSGPAGAIF